MTHDRTPDPTAPAALHVYARHGLVPGPGATAEKDPTAADPGTGEDRSRYAQGKIAPEVPQGPSVRASMTLDETYQVLREILGDRVDEYFSRMYQYDSEAMSPRHQKEIDRRGFAPLTGRTTLQDLRYRWIAIYPATGGSEGHYIHVDLVWQKEYQEGRVPLFLGKTFQGMAHATEIACILIRELDKAGIV